MRKINTIILHCSDSAFGNAELIGEWHVDRGWRMIGYHIVILNSYPTADHYKFMQPDCDSDGVVETGRPVASVGAHAKGYNRNSIGICLIGEKLFTSKQIETSMETCSKLIHDYGIQIEPQTVNGKIVSGILGYNEVLSDGNLKTCPNIDMKWYRNQLRRINNV